MAKGDKDLPQAWLDFQLCTEVYHCLPSELDNENDADIHLHVLLLGVKADHDYLESKRAEQRAKHKK